MKKIQYIVWGLRFIVAVSILSLLFFIFDISNAEARCLAGTSGVPSDHYVISAKCVDAIATALKIGSP